MNSLIRTVRYTDTDFFVVSSHAKQLYLFNYPFIIILYRCTIDWKKGKNVTVKVVKKKQKHKGRGTTRMVTKTVHNDSFFNFFSPPNVPEDGAEVVSRHRT